MATKKASSFSKLSKAKQKAVATKIVRAIRAMGYVTGGKYKIVSSPDINLRERGFIETAGEDKILNGANRGRLLDMARNQARNSSTLCAILKQFDLNAVGTTGGKASFVFDDAALADEVREKFARWTRDADFFDGLGFGSFLKLVLKTYILGGDMVIVFDDGLVEDSGRLMLYEPDEIGNLADADFERVYGKSARQSLGRVYNANSRFIGVIVSRSCRGITPFRVDSSYCLRHDPNSSFLESNWIMPRNVFRIAQGRGVTPLAAPLSTIIDLEDLTNYELQAAKKNSQTLAQVIDTGSQPEDPTLGSAFAPGTDFTNMTDAELADAVAAESEAAPVTVTLDAIKNAGAIYESMPEGKKLELLDTKHPNAAMPEFIRWLAGRSAAPFGLGSVYATLKADASYTAFRGEQVMSQPAFEEAQKFLEGICDWVIYRWANWAQRKGIIGELPKGWLRKVAWQWPRMREVNQVDEQNAIGMKLKNGTGSYLEIYGADWKEKLLQISEEVKFCQEHGLPHPSLQTVSGGIIETDNSNKEITQ